MRQSIWKQLQVPYASANDITESPPTFLEELNRQCEKILFFSSLIALIAWLPHITIDLRLHPNYPIIIAFRLGLSLIGLTVLILQFFQSFNRHKLLLLIFMVAYVEIAMGIITGLTKADPAYLGGYYLVISFLALGPYPRKVAWAILAVSLAGFFAVGFSVGMQFDSLRARYGLIDLFVVAIMASLLVYILDRMRFNRWLIPGNTAEMPKTMRIPILAVIFLFLTGCIGLPKGIEPVDDFEINRYLGKWYEIARLDHSFERGLSRVSAEYSLRADGGVRVINKGFSEEKNQWKQAEGKAYFSREPNEGYLKVSFFGPFYGSYVIFELDRKNYQYAY